MAIVRESLMVGEKLQRNIQNMQRTRLSYVKEEV